MSEPTPETTENTSLADLPLFATTDPSPEPFDAHAAIAQVMRRPLGTTSSTPEPTPTTSPQPSGEEALWEEADLLAAAISAQMASDSTLANLGEEETRRRGLEYIDRQVREERLRMTSDGRQRWSDAFETRLREAVESKLFGLGRLQALVDNDDVENIEIIGCDQVFLLMADGRRVQAAPVASSDEELISDLSFLAARRAHSERSFNPSSPFLSLSLPGGHRLQAAAWVTPRPRVTIRRHRLVDIGLDDLVELGEMDPTLRDFLAAAVRDHRSIVVSGAGQGSGKTTLVRALANVMDPWESIVTVETEYELFLDQMPQRHKIVTALEMRPGSGEIGADGKPAGEVGIPTLMFNSLRFNASRVIVGEVRGLEVLGMFEAMQMGNGSLSTIHANSAQDVIERLVTCSIENATSETHAYRMVGQHINLIVYLSNEVDENGHKQRFISEVIEVSLGEGDRKVSVTNVFTPGPDGRAIPATPPSFMDGLVAQGFSRSAFAAAGRTNAGKGRR